MNIGGPLVNADGPVPVFDHLSRITDARGLFEHAEHAIPRPEHGYCVDDVARGLVVVCREPKPDAMVRQLASCYLDFVLDGLDPTGTCHNRMDVAGEWRDLPTVGDWWGRALWGLGVAVRSARTAGMRARALTGFRIAAQQRSPHIRSMAFAALGAAEVLLARPAEVAARALLRDAIDAICAIDASADGEPGWPWLESRLTYANATLAEALIVGGAGIGDGGVVVRGLELLDFLLRTEVRGGHLSVTPVGGRGRESTVAAFDQQPIEVAALADACASAGRVTGDSTRQIGIDLAWRWFCGDNDSATQMFDAQTGGGYDGLEANGRNLNQGAESTLAMLSTAQHARRLSRSG